VGLNFDDFVGQAQAEKEGGNKSICRSNLILNGLQNVFNDFKNRFQKKRRTILKTLFAPWDWCGWGGVWGAGRGGGINEF
jgi:hypothetical protein